MSVQQDHLKMNTEKAETHDGHVDQPPKLEVANSHESLEAFGAALGGAILGVLATLLILAIINNGTLRFDGANVGEMEAYLTRVDENVEIVQSNVESLSDRLTSLESNVQTSLGDLDAALVDQDVRLNELDEVVVALERTSQNFDIFTSALAEALREMDAATEESAAPAAPAESAAPVDDAWSPAVAADAALPGDAIQAFLFVDNNGNGVLDEEEANLVGATVTLTTPAGEEISGESTDSGVLFSDLEAGEYTVNVEDAMGFELAGEASASVTVAEEDESGQVVYFPVAAE